MEKEPKLKEFLERYGACSEGIEFAGNLTLKQAIRTCKRGDWLLWLFVRTNPRAIRKRVLVA